MTILVADAGATKIDWVLIAKNNKEDFNTIGVNPYYYKSDKIYHILYGEIPEIIKEARIGKIFFYGAGCSDKVRINRVKKALQQIFPLTEIYVDHDLLGAARSLCWEKPGIIGILGTGSNACVYDGKKITKQHGGIGFILGDEGSGAIIGKKLVTHYMYGELPHELNQAFILEFGDDNNKLIDKIYRNTQPNQYLATFTKFIEKNQEHPFISDLILDSFDEYVRRHILVFEEYKTLPFNAVGSIAFYFKKRLKMVLDKYSIVMGKIDKKPIDGIVTYHLDKY